ncbi:MAG: hypothetical protein ACREA0_04200, partial [bacterium]
PMYTSEFPNDERLIEAVRTCPTLLQTRLNAQSDARVVTIGSATFAAERRRDQDDPPDWREIDPEGRGFRLVEAENLESQATMVATKLGLRFTAQDWVRTQEGNVFVEANPAGQWLFLPDDRGNSITGALADAILTL